MPEDSSRVGIISLLVLKAKTLIGLLQQKLADRRRVCKATVDTPLHQTHGCRPNYSQITLKIQIAAELAKLSPGTPPKEKRVPNNYNQLQPSSAFKQLSDT